MMNETTQITVTQPTDEEIYQQAQVLEKSSNAQHWKEAVALYIQLAEKHYPKAIFRLAQIRHYGQLNFPQDIDLAYKNYARAIFFAWHRKDREYSNKIYIYITEHFSVEECYQLIQQLHLFLDKVPSTYTISIPFTGNPGVYVKESLNLKPEQVRNILYNYYQWAADKGEVRACLQIGKWEVDFEKALKYYHAALENKKEEVLYWIARLYEYGRSDHGIDWRKAAEYYKEAAKSEDTKAIGRLAEAYRLGELGITSNYKKAMRLYFLLLQKTIENQADKLCLDDVAPTLQQLLCLSQKGVQLVVSHEEVKKILDFCKNWLEKNKNQKEIQFTAKLIYCVFSQLIGKYQQAKALFLKLDMATLILPSRHYCLLNLFQIMVSELSNDERVTLLKQLDILSKFIFDPTVLLLPEVIKSYLKTRSLSEDEKKLLPKYIKKLLAFNLYHLFHIRHYPMCDDKSLLAYNYNRFNKQIYLPHEIDVYHAHWYGEYVVGNFTTSYSRAFWTNTAIKFLDFLEVRKEFFELLSVRALYDVNVEESEDGSEENRDESEDSENCHTWDKILENFVRFFYHAYNEWSDKNVDGDYQRELEATLKKHFSDLYSTLLSRRQQNLRVDTEEQQKELQSWHDLALSFVYDRRCKTINAVNLWSKFQPSIVEVKRRRDSDVLDEDSLLEQPFQQLRKF